MKQWKIIPSIYTGFCLFFEAFLNLWSHTIEHNYYWSNRKNVSRLYSLSIYRSKNTYHCCSFWFLPIWLMVCTDSPTVPPISSGWYSGITFKLPCQSSTYVAIKNKKQVVSVGEIKVSIQFRARNIYYVHHIWSSNCKKDWTLSLKTESSACQLWWGSLFKSCDHIQIPLYQRASWCHLWQNNVK